MTRLGEFELRRIDDDWQVWEVTHNGQKVMDVSADVARGIYTRKYDPAALAEGRLVKSEEATDGKTVHQAAG